MSMETPSTPRLELPRDQELDPVVIERKEEILGAELLLDQSKSLVASMGDTAIGKDNLELAA